MLPLFMSKLKNIRVGQLRLTARLGPLADEAARDRRRCEVDPWRAWYASARWRALRLDVLLRDGWRCAICDVVLCAGRKAARSAVVDHRRAHRGDPMLFWDPHNLQAMCKTCHDAEKQRRERVRGWS